MAKLSVYNFVSLDGYYKSIDGDISWHTHGEEEHEFSIEQLSKDHILMFGRVTYELMADLWPTKEAVAMAPIVAKGMNDAEKIVFSRTMGRADWNNTRIIKDNMIAEVELLKRTSPKDMTILGSGNVLTQLADAGLIDEYQIMIDPKLIGDGVSMFKGLTKHIPLQLVDTKVFKSGIVLLRYVRGDMEI